MTKIRTFDKTVLTVPNSVFSKVILENKTKMTHRRFSETIGIRYEDIRKVSTLVEKLEALLSDFQGVCPKMIKSVSLVSLGAYSVDIRFYCFIMNTSYLEYADTRQRLLLAIIEAVHDCGCDFAFPTQTLDIPALEQNNQKHELVANQTFLPTTTSM